MYNRSVCSPRTNTHKCVNLCYICKNGHCYPILDEGKIESVKRSDRELFQWRDIICVDMSEKVHQEDNEDIAEGDIPLVDNIEDESREL